MKALQKIHAMHGVDMVDVPVPKCGPTDLLIKIQRTALCKSDLEVIEWTPLVAAANYQLPLILGHEFAGNVVEVGNLVENFKLGDKVAGETHIPCGYCHECKSDMRHLCSNHMGVLGRTVDGCFTEYIKLPAVSAIKLPDYLDYSEASLMEPLATALHALQKIEPSGKKIAILGAGTIGLMACELAKILGADRIVTLDINQKRLDYSIEKGATLAFNGTKCDFVKEVKGLC
jgi:threonine 3-dehydrogenase